MNKEQIEQKKKELINEFSALEEKRRSLLQDINNIATQQVKLQGAHDLLESIEKDMGDNSKE